MHQTQYGNVYQLRLRPPGSVVQHGMELLAEIRGTKQSLEGMNAFLEHRPADFDQFRIRNKAALDQYRSEFAQGRNQGETSRAARS